MSLLFFYQCHYCAENCVGIEHLTDSYCIPSKTSVNKTSVFKNSTSQHTSDMVAIEPLRNSENKAWRLNVSHTRKKDLGYFIHLPFLNLRIKFFRAYLTCFITLYWGVEIGKSQSWFCNNFNKVYSIVQQKLKMLMKHKVFS